MSVVAAYTCNAKYGTCGWWSGGGTFPRDPVNAMGKAIPTGSGVGGANKAGDFTIYIFGMR